MATLKTWEGKNGAGRYTRISEKSWFDVYHELEEKEMLANQHDYSPYEKALADKNNIDWKDYFACLGEIVCDIYEYAKQRGIELVDLTEDELRSLIYDETIHEYSCEMLEYKYAIENKWHDETEKFETLDEAGEKLAEYEEDDREEGTYEKGYYRIIDLTTGKEVE